MMTFFEPRTLKFAVFSVISAVAMALPAHAQRPGTYSGAQVKYLFSGSEMKAEGGECTMDSAMILYRHLRMAALHMPLVLQPLTLANPVQLFVATMW